MKLTRKKLLSVITTLTIVLLLYFSGPTSAITVAMNAITATLYQGDKVTIQTNITIQDYEFIMTPASANITIQTNAIDSGNRSFSCQLPLNGTNTALSVTCGNGNTVTVTSTTTAGATLAYTYGYGYEYGYTPSSGATYAYNVYGYGYAFPDGGAYSYWNGSAYVWEGSTQTWNATSLYYTVILTLEDYYGSGTFNSTTAVYSNAYLVSSATVSFTVGALTSLPGQTEGGGKITEIYMNPVGDDSTKTVCDGEWVEIYNNKSTTVNLTNWNLTNRDSEAITIDSAHLRSGSSLVVPATGFTVVCFNASDGYSDWLDNSEETISLVAANGSRWDSLVYSAASVGASAPTMVTTNVSVADAVSIAQTTTYFKKNISLIILANGSMTAVVGGSPGEVNPGGSGSTSISLASAWNLISLPLTPDNTATNVTFAPIYGNYTIIYYYNASIGSGTKWMYWDATVPGGSGNNLNYTLASHGYWIYMNASSTLSLTGTLPSTTDIALNNSWNMIGYPSLTTTRETNTTLGALYGNYTIIYLYNASITSGTKWRYWDATVPGGSGNNLNYTVPNYGYWIYVNATTATLTI